MNATADLPLFAPHAAPAVEAGDVEALERLLLRAGGWRTESEVLVALGRADTESQKRQVRRWANLSPRIISGQDGYKHLKHASVAEVQHCCAALECQAKEVAERVGRIRREFHKSA